MTGIIWYYSNKGVGLNKLKDIMCEYVRIGIEPKDVKTDRVIFENGDCWSVAPAKDCCRGRACNVAYIERRTPDEIIDYIIMPAIKSFPYRAYNYYGG